MIELREATRLGREDNNAALLLGRLYLARGDFESANALLRRHVSCAGLHRSGGAPPARLDGGTTRPLRRGPGVARGAPQARGLPGPCAGGAGAGRAAHQRGKGGDPDPGGGRPRPHRSALRASRAPVDRPAPRQRRGRAGARLGRAGRRRAIPPPSRPCAAICCWSSARRPRRGRFSRRCWKPIRSRVPRSPGSASSSSGRGARRWRWPSSNGPWPPIPAIRTTPISPLRRSSLWAATEQGASELRALLRRNPEHLAACNDLAWLLAEQGEDLDLALALATRAARIDPRPEVLDTLGWVRLRRGEIEPAIAAFEKALAERPELSTARYHLGLALVQRGDEEAARQAFRAALDAGPFPESEAARRELERLAPQEATSQ